MRECFFFGDCLGFLMSSGEVGLFYKDEEANLMLEFGQAHYLFSKKGQRAIKKSVPEGDFEIERAADEEPEHHLQTLMNFKSYFVTKYGIFKLEEMRKRHHSAKSVRLSASVKKPKDDEEEIVTVRKVVALPNGEIITRLSNGVIQLHFNDLTSLFLSREESDGLYYTTTHGRVIEADYQECNNGQLRKKIRRFSNMIKKLSEKQGKKNSRKLKYQEVESSDNADYSY